ncbi:MAG: aminomethyl-transferring glycine dehydrogenase subunit GcvPB [bacterium]
MPKKLLFELSSPRRKAFNLPKLDVPQKEINTLIPQIFLREKDTELPELGELETIRHFVQVSTLNHHIDKGFYPLGSCTMKYNPLVNEDIARFEGFANVHPLQPESTTQGSLQIMYELSEYLQEISGMQAVSLQPAAGAQGELTGLMMIRAYHDERGQKRKNILIPDSAHGTNPASVTITGYKSVQIKSNSKGRIDLEHLKENLNEDTAGLMLTNPNTLGLFETQIKEISQMLHEVGALMYMDGANLNALLHIVRPGDMGFDVVHINLHKTFSTPHGGGGPGAGPVGVSARLVDYLPVPRIKYDGDKYFFDFNHSKSIGKVSSFYGNFGIFVRAYSYIRMHGAKGLKRISENAILNANYLMTKLKDHFTVPYEGPAMHEFVLSGDNLRKHSVKTTDLAKRLLDYGFHAPTIYFPLIVREAIMIEPTETETKETLDDFAAAMIQITKEAEENPEKIKNAPYTTPVSRLDEVKAVRQLNIKYK